jgi:hypothetical protein
MRGSLGVDEVGPEARRVDTLAENACRPVARSSRYSIRVDGRGSFGDMHSKMRPGSSRPAARRASVASKQHDFDLSFLRPYIDRYR